MSLLPLHDLRYAARMLRQNSGLTLAAVLALALGIGITTATFSVIDGVLLKPLPFEEAGRLVQVREKFTSRGPDGMPLPAGNYWDYYNENQFFAKLGAYRSNPFSLTSPGSDPERYLGVAVTQDFFDVFGVRPVLGRGFATEEMEPGRDDVVIIGHGLWSERFGADPSLLGRKITLNGRDRTVVGIMPPGFEHPNKSRIWAPATFAGFDRTRRDFHTLAVTGRLKPEATLEQARTQFQAILNRIASEAPEFAKDKLMVMTPMMEDVTGKVRPALLALLGAVAFVLLISCANVANLLLARGVARQQEMAVRAALGAERWRLFRQLLTESALLSLLGGTLGVAIAYGAFIGLKRLAPPSLPRLDQVAIDARVLGFALAITLLTGLVFGLLPALRLSRVDLNHALKERARGSSAATGLRGLLVVSQVAAALVLLTGAGLLIRSFYEVTKVDLGFQPDHLVTMRVTPLPTKYNPSQPLQIQLGRDILSKVRETPGVQSVGFSTDLPLLGNPRYIMRFEGFPPVTVATAPLADFFTVSPDYFRTMGIALKRGRFLTEADDARSANVCLVNEALVRTYFPGKDPIGQRLEIGFSTPPNWRQIVGVVADVKNVDIEKPTPVQVYGAYLHQPGILPGAPSLSIVARTAGDPALMAEPVRRAVLAADNSQPVYAVQTMETVVTTHVSQRRFTLLLMCLFAAVALALAAIGLAGVISYMVTQRTQEIGIRIALGAQIRDVVWLVEAQTLKLAGWGLLLGIVGALALSRSLSTMLFGISAQDPWTYVAVALALAAVALVAGYIPARRAARIDPVIALRQD
ncbi:MAG: ABC transporter permease [Acidobacteria bacterium]|nr:ABC transporter permease [Acidobacteriota bacterium]